jgi:hypothetical protein
MFGQTLDTITKNASRIFFAPFACLISRTFSANEQYFLSQQISEQYFQS